MISDIRYPQHNFLPYYQQDVIDKRKDEAWKTNMQILIYAHNAQQLDNKSKDNYTSLKVHLDYHAPINNASKSLGPSHHH